MKDIKGTNSCNANKKSVSFNRSNGPKSIHYFNSQSSRRSIQKRYDYFRMKGSSDSARKLEGGVYQV